MILATISTRPKITSGLFSHEDVIHKRVNLLHFGNVHRMPYDEYEAGMREMMNDNEYLRRSMIEGIHGLGRELARKHMLLRYAYNVFMYGIVVSVLAYLIALALVPATS
jgi:hypothetical protein